MPGESPAPLRDVKSTTSSPLGSNEAAAAPAFVLESESCSLLRAWSLLLVAAFSNSWPKFRCPPPHAQPELD